MKILMFNRDRAEQIVKCACGLTMRQKDWAGHWNGCRYGSSVPVTEEDVAALLDYEERQRDQAEEFRKWRDRRQQMVASGKIDVFGRALA